MQDLKSKKISNCRVCSSQSLSNVITLDKMPFTDEFITDDKIGHEYLADIEIGICANCGSVQNLNNTDMDDYYSEYTYTVQSSNFAMSFMKKLSENIKNYYFSKNKSPKVLEIGSGSGEQLMEFKTLGFDVIGIEPSIKLSDYANCRGILTVPSFFDENTTEIIDSKFRKVDLVISSYTFDHIPMPSPVLVNIFNILNDDGILVLEVHNLDLIRERNEFCLFEHEHYTYLNENTMTYLLNLNGFDVLSFDLLTNSDKRANSLLVSAQKKVEPLKLIDYSLEEQSFNASKLSDNIFNSISNFENWLEKNSQKTIVAYGAGGRGIMTLAAIKNADIIKFIVDKNPKDSNIFSPKSNLPVFDIAKLSDDRVDIIIVFSFGYFNEIVEEVTSKFGYSKSQFISILDILNIA
jgi:SAM-dependent methyltransferase